MGFNFNNFVHRYATKQPEITQQPHVGGTITSRLKACTPEFPRAKRLKKSLPEKKPVILVTIDDEIIVDEPAPAAQQETKAMAPQVSFKLNKALLACHSTSLVSPPLIFNEAHFTIQL